MDVTYWGGPRSPMVQGRGAAVPVVSERARTTFRRVPAITRCREAVPSRARLAWRAGIRCDLVIRSCEDVTERDGQNRNVKVLHDFISASASRQSDTPVVAGAKTPVQRGATSGLGRRSSGEGKRRRKKVVLGYTSLARRTKRSRKDRNVLDVQRDQPNVTALAPSRSPRA
jgi:hypothetical protein